MENIEDLATRLFAYKDRWPEIADRSGVPLATVVKIGRGYTKGPRLVTAGPIMRVLDEFEMPKRRRKQ